MMNVKQQLCRIMQELGMFCLCRLCMKICVLIDDLDNGDNMFMIWFEGVEKSDEIDEP